MKNHEFNRRGGFICSNQQDKRLAIEASAHGSEAVYGRYELGCFYVAQIIDGFPDFVGLPNGESPQVKIVNKDQFPLENGKHYVFQLTKIQLGELRVLIKVKFRAIEEFDMNTLKD